MTLPVHDLDDLAPTAPDVPTVDAHAHAPILSSEEMEALVEANLPIASSTVASMLTRVPGWVRQDELYSAAVVGLFDAAQRFDPSQGVPFAAFARPRVKGAVLDELRRGDWAPRSVRRAARTEQQATAQLATEMGRAPTDDELAAHIGVGVAELVKARHDATLAWTASFVTSEHEDASPATSVGPARSLTPEDVLLDRETHGYLHDAIGALSERRAEVVRRYYLEGEEMRAIAEDWGVTVSRVSQIAAEAVATLRDGLSPLLDMGATPQPRTKGAQAGLDKYRDQVQKASTMAERLSTPVVRHDL